MKIHFATSEQSSLGVEWELQLVDLDSLELTPAAAPLMELVDGGEDRPIRKEYLQCMIEIVSRPQKSVSAAIADIAQQLERLTAAAATLNVGLLAAGAHPFSDPTKQNAFRTPRYDLVAEKNQWWGRQMAICGTHVHVGIDSVAKVLPITWTFARFYPYLLALSASSPFWAGTDTGYASQRTMMFQQLPSNGLPYMMDSWEDFESFIADLIAAEMLTEVNELRWDVRPSPRFGTVENRIPDAAPTLRELAFIAALTQSLGEYLSDALAAGDTPDYLAPWLVKENKWRAARYGLDAMVITPNPAERLLPLREGMRNLLAFLEPYALKLDCLSELTFGYELLDKGASYERQRRWHSQGADWAQITRNLLHETSSEPLWQ